LPVTKWNLCKGLTSCDNGSKTVYVRMYKSDGTILGDIHDDIMLSLSQ